MRTSQTGADSALKTVTDIFEGSFNDSTDLEEYIIDTEFVMSYNKTPTTGHAHTANEDSGE